MDEKKKAEDIGCRCKHTQCLKKYCQCFAAGKVCTQQCICVSCANGRQNVFVMQVRDETQQEDPFGKFLDLLES